MNTPMYLKLFISPHSDDDLKEKYIQAIEKHNIKAASSHPDAGFDLFCPISEIVHSKTSIWLDMQVKAAAFTHNHPCEERRPVSYYMYPRSSISKTPLRLSNSVGVIDSGYRGEVLVGIVNLSEDEHTFEKGDKVAQMLIQKVESIEIEEVEELDETERGEKGFGSSGK